MLKSQDLVVLARLLLAENRAEPTSYPTLSLWTGLSASECHAAVKRLYRAGLTSAALQNPSTFDWHVVRPAAEEFITHAIRYLWPIEPLGEQRGVPTGTAVKGLNEGDSAVYEADRWVWPSAKGTDRGQAIKPLYPTLPEKVGNDSLFHQSLAALDLTRSPLARLRNLGRQWIQTSLLRRS
jgi:hypothetical protein